jgi:hypothetical protein
LVGLSACGGGGVGPTGPHVLPPLRPGPSAVTVIGQASFFEGQANRGGTVGGASLHTPIGNVELTPDGTLFVPDSFNGRILAYRDVPGTNGAPATFVVGKPDFTTPRSPDASESFIETPASVSVSVGKMAIADQSAHRVLVYDTVPDSTGALATFVVGQTSFTARDSGGCLPSALRFPSSAIVTPNDKLVVADTLNNRVLIWNAVPRADGQPADAVLGQRDFTHCIANDADQDGIVDPNPQSTTLSEPLAVWSDGRRLVVADTSNHRVLIWNQLPLDATGNFKPADVVLGQRDFERRTINDRDGNGFSDGAPFSTTLMFPRAVHSDGVRLAVADGGNHRVLVWNTFPTQSRTPADRVFGQGEFNRAAPNDADSDGAEDPAPSGAVLNNPRGVLLNGNRLFVTDTGNHRVLVFQLDP